MGSEENMKVCVYGLGHLGSVTAACLASVGNEVLAIDKNVLAENGAIIGEPGLTDLTNKGGSSRKLIFSPELRHVKESEILWVTFDTPVDDNDRADVDFVLDKIREVMPYVAESTPVIVSSQLPVGTIRKLEGEFPRHTFVCIPENLRHGTAVENFLHPDRIVVGMRDDGSEAAGEPFSRINLLLLPIVHTTEKFVWMSPESAEMTKHAINAFLATSICFINEIAAICKLVGADPAEVERGLKTEERIGPKAYLKPGGPYTGKTLARDVEYLCNLPKGEGFPLMHSIRNSNEWKTRRDR
jgi:UDPglucose 6-dehydrogenase